MSAVSLTYFPKVTPQMAESVLRRLDFPRGIKILTLIATVSASTLAAWCRVPASDIVHAVPLPPVARYVWDGMMNGVVYLKTVIFCCWCAPFLYVPCMHPSVRYMYRAYYLSIGGGGMRQKEKKRDRRRKMRRIIV